MTPHVSLADEINQIAARIKALPAGPKRSIAERELAEVEGVIRFLGSRLDDTVGRISPTPSTKIGLKR